MGGMEVCVTATRFHEIEISVHARTVGWDPRLRLFHRYAVQSGHERFSLRGCYFLTRNLDDRCVQLLRSGRIEDEDEDDFATTERLDQLDLLTARLRLHQHRWRLFLQLFDGGQAGLLFIEVFVN